jgi:hypothetical protein
MHPGAALWLNSRDDLLWPRSGPSFSGTHLVVWHKPWSPAHLVTGLLFTASTEDPEEDNCASTNLTEHGPKGSLHRQGQAHLSYYNKTYIESLVIAIYPGSNPTHP